ncbi:MAG TPA: hypothetical protein VFM14_18755 [Gemmatimonadales bacterium]|nr:hypothetical protein [Gemmatimonadales bacterium]
MRYSILLVAVLVTPLAAQQSKPIDPANFDTACAPCSHFFRYANGRWLDRVQIPGDQPGRGAFHELQEDNFAALREVLTSSRTRVAVRCATSTGRT